MRAFLNYAKIYRKHFTKRIWMRVCRFVSMSLKLLVFIGLLQQVFVVSKRINFFTWVDVRRLWPLEHLMLALNARTPSWRKTIIMSFYVDHFLSPTVHVFWWFLATSWSWTLFILHRIQQILGKCLYKTNLIVINDFLSVNILMLYWIIVCLFYRLIIQTQMYEAYSNIT